MAPKRRAHQVRAQFNVAIRTVVVDTHTGQAKYGTWGGWLYRSRFGPVVIVACFCPASAVGHVAPPSPTVAGLVFKQPTTAGTVLETTRIVFSVWRRPWKALIEVLAVALVIAGVLIHHEPGDQAGSQRWQGR
jgi:hypothetical protein